MGAVTRAALKTPSGVTDHAERTNHAHRFLHRDETATHLPFILETPAYNALLPEMPIMTNAPGWKNDLGGNSMFPATNIRRQPVSVVLGNEELGTFQISAKCSSLLHRALRLDKDRSSLPHMSTTIFSDLDQELRRATQTLLERSMHWELMLDCFSMCIRYVDEIHDKACSFDLHPMSSVTA